VKLSDLSIRRPVLTWMVTLGLVVFGLVSFGDMGIDLFPRVEFPVITIVSVLPGADPETVESTVSDPIEEAVSTISAIKHLRSTSADSVSQVVVEFELEKDIDVAYQEVQAKLGAIRSELPEDVEDPVVEKFDIDASPIMAVVVSGDMPVRELTRVADKTIKERLQRVPNVGQVRLVGGRDRQIWLRLDRAKLEGFDLSVQDVESALRTRHVEIPGGRLETGPNEFVVKTKAEFESAEQFAAMVVAYRQGAPIRVRDLGYVDDGIEEERSLARLDGAGAIALLVRRQSGSNTVRVAQEVKAEIASLREELGGSGIRLEIAQDMSVFIDQSVAEVEEAVLIGALLTILIVFVFLRNIRTTFITAIVIPTAVIAAFTLMSPLGFTLNMMTLLAFSLVIGVLNDDAIVVVENSSRHVEHGEAPKVAASNAMKEIGFAVLAMSMTLVAVFVPVAFMKGLVGRFFFQFALTITFAIIFSTYLALTLSPMLCGHMLKKPREGRLFRLLESGFKWIEGVYGATLRGALRLRWLVVLLAITAFVGAGYIGRLLRVEFLPAEDQAEFNIKAKAPLGASLARTNAVTAEIRNRIGNPPWLDYVFTTIGADELKRVNEGTIYVKLTPKGQRPTSQDEVMRWVRQEVADMEGVKVSVERVPRVAGGGRKWADVQLDVRGQDLDKLESICDAIIERMRSAGGYADIDTTYEKGKPEVNVYVDRARAADLGVSPLVVASTVRALIGGEDIGRFRAEGDRYDISVRLQAPHRDTAHAIELLSLRNNRGELIRLRNVADVRVEAGPVQIDRYNRTRQITILANLNRDQKVLGEAVDELNRFVEEADLPPGYSAGFAGMAEIMKESFENLVFALLLAVIVVYMVLAGQFESLMHPLTVMISVPLSVVGALGALVALDMTMSIFTMIGIIMLMGLVTKNAILLVDFTNMLRREKDLDCKAAVLAAGPIRLRPILMTTAGTILGMLPIALGTGAGSESRAPMAVAVIGGLATSTLLTLLVVPVVYTLFDDLRHPSQWRLVRWLRRDGPQRR